MATLWARLGTFFAGIWAKVAIVAAALIALAAAIAQIRKGGKDSQRADDLAAAAKVKGRMEDADAAGPRTGADAADRLRDGTF